MRPAQNSHSKACFSSLQPHQPPEPFAPSMSEAAIGPRVGDFPINVLDQAGMFARRTWRGRRKCPRCGAARSMRQRISGYVSTGRNDASCAQYSNSLRLRPDSRIVEQRHRIRPEPRKQRHVVRPHDRAHRIDLQQADAGKNPVQMPAIDRARRARIGEPLRGQRDAPRRGERYLFSHLPRGLDGHGGGEIVARFGGRNRRFTPILAAFSVKACQER